MYMTNKCFKCPMSGVILLERCMAESIMQFDFDIYGMVASSSLAYSSRNHYGHVLSLGSGKVLSLNKRKWWQWFQLALIQHTKLFSIDLVVHRFIYFCLMYSVKYLRCAGTLRRIRGILELHPYRCYSGR